MAAQKGVPFLPMRGVIGTDLLNYRDDWMVIDNPFNVDQKDRLRSFQRSPAGPH
jgi:hypothetical protein